MAAPVEPLEHVKGTRPDQVTREDTRQAAAVAAEAAVVKADARVSTEQLEASRRNKINMLWEYTQAFLAVALTVSAVYSALTISPIPEALNNALFVVIGFYFGRTNHARPTPTNPRGDA